MLCDLRPWLLDSLGFMMEQLESAKSPQDQIAGTDAAMGIIPFLRCRLREDAFLAAHFALLLEALIDADHYKRIWTSMANSKPEEFKKSADEILDRLAVLKGIVASPPPIEEEAAN